ncbi:MAG: RedB protein [Deltaproteobacteria bacterium]|nr:RedB protein [Deltaproteobacteria bacterium]
MYRLSIHEFTPGPPAIGPSSWPVESHIPRQPHQPTLVMLAHPQCSCTRASIGELAILMAQLPRPVEAHVVFLTPTTLTGTWEQTDLWQSAAAIPGVQVFADRDGQEARLFQVTTSGQVLLYDERGRLAFAGGITASRGHSGENEGRHALLSLLTAAEPLRTTTPVFGCSLFSHSPRT